MTLVRRILFYILSRLASSLEDEPLDDSFLAEHIFPVYASTPWFVDIVIYLVAGKFLQQFSYKEHCGQIQKSGPFTWICGN